MLVNFPFDFWNLSWWSLKMHSWSVTWYYCWDLSGHCCCLFVKKSWIVKTLSRGGVLLKETGAHRQRTTMGIYSTFLFPLPGKLWRRWHYTVLFVVGWWHCIHSGVIHFHHFIAKRISRGWTYWSHWDIYCLILSVIEKIFDLFEVIRIKLRKISLG